MDAAFGVVWKARKLLSLDRCARVAGFERHLGINGTTGGWTGWSIRLPGAYRETSVAYAAFEAGRQIAGQLRLVRIEARAEARIENRNYKRVL